MRDPAVPQSVRWRVNASGGISSSPSYGNGTIYVDSNGGVLSAIDYRTGSVRWRFHANNKLMSAPLLYGDTVIVSSGDEQSRVWDPPHYVVLGSGPSTLYGVDARTGRERWHLGIAGTGMPTGVVAGGLYIHVNGTGTMIALDPLSGHVRWRTNVASSSAMTALADLGDGTILGSGGFPNAVYRVRARDGTVVWDHRFPDCAAAFTDQPVAADTRHVYGGYLKLLTPNPRCFGVRAEGVQHAYALDLRTGKLLWDRVLSRGEVPSRNEGAIPLVHDGIVYMGSSLAPEMHALDGATGRLLWKRTVRGAVKSGSVIVGGKQYFGDLGGMLWALDSKHGTIRGRLHEGLPFNVGSPIVVNRTLIIGSRQGAVLAIPIDAVR
ncbi:MAG TPA: PQQ-binding-like beta-propeller repeat protein [Candidatus Baltobacteraceae bacterium]|nr:PQQ-binding-like beta-propeller repeat protein [Candidatus Baltobacteraceae bacterium]